MLLNPNDLYRVIARGPPDIQSVALLFWVPGWWSWHNCSARL